jgi:hypothetical protein
MDNKKQIAIINKISKENGISLQNAASLFIAQYAKTFRMLKADCFLFNGILISMKIADIVLYQEN